MSKSEGMAGGVSLATATRGGALGPRSSDDPRPYDLNLGIQKQIRINERQIFDQHRVGIRALNYPAFEFHNWETSSSLGANGYSTMWPERLNYRITITSDDRLP
jgi:hypothetical protein